MQCESCQHVDIAMIQLKLLVFSTFRDRDLCDNTLQIFVLHMALRNTGNYLVCDNSSWHLGSTYFSGIGIHTVRDF